MTKLLEQAFEKASELSTEEQNSLAKWLMLELESERRWDEAFARSSDKLENLAAEALLEHRRGETRDLDPETL